MKCRLLLFKTFTILVLSCFSLGYAKDFSLNRHQFVIGPEWYYVDRVKCGGTKQNGNLFGVRLGYDRLKRFGFYWGIDGLIAHGRLKGHAGSGHKLHSRLTDSSVEGRLGFTFQQKTGWQCALTPYAGVGYFNETNKFKHPSPVTAHFKTYFPYAAVGFLSWMHPCDRVELGLNFKAKIPFEPKCRVTNDPEHKRVTQRIDERMHYRVELPLTYRLSCDGHTGVSLIPFYEYRKYDHYPNFPFNFIKTIYNNYGLTLEFVYRI